MIYKQLILYLDPHSDAGSECGSMQIRDAAFDLSYFSLDATLTAPKPSLRNLPGLESSAAVQIGDLRRGLVGWIGTRAVASQLRSRAAVFEDW